MRLSILSRKKSLIPKPRPSWRNGRRRNPWKSPISITANMIHQIGPKSQIWSKKVNLFLTGNLLKIKCSVMSNQDSSTPPAELWRPTIGNPPALGARRKVSWRSLAVELRWLLSYQWCLLSSSASQQHCGLYCNVNIAIVSNRASARAPPPRSSSVETRFSR